MYPFMIQNFALMNLCQVSKNEKQQKKNETCDRICPNLLTCFIFIDPSVFSCCFNKFT